MANALSAFGDAFAAYKKSPSDFVVYSIIMEIASIAMGAVLAALLIVVGAISIGSLSNLFTSGFSFNVVGLGVAVIVVAVGVLIFAWVASGLNGSYLESLNSFLSGRKQTIGGFFGAIPKRATQLFLVGIISVLILAIPAAVIAVVFSLGGSIAALIGILFAVLYVLIMSILLSFAIPAVVLDNLGAAAAVGRSIAAGRKNFLALVIYFIVSGIAFIPAIIPFLNLLYLPLFYMPVVQSAFLLLYKKAR